MKIGVDMFGNQERNRGRGIGRYTRQLVKQLLSRFPQHEYVLYYHEGLPGIDDPWPAKPAVRVLQRPASPDFGCAPSDLLTAENPDGLDVLLLSCAFDCHRTHLPPLRTVRGPKVACILYDMIPALFRAEYLATDTEFQSYHSALGIARQYDRLLAISETSRRDGIQVLNVPEDRVVNIGAGSDGSFFRPDASQPMPAAASAILTAYGLQGPFIFCASSNDDRKNLKGLLLAYQQMAAELRQSHQLLVTCAMDARDLDYRLNFARELGIYDRLVLIGAGPSEPNYPSDDAMRVFYQRCSAFVSSSFYEGFGLTILEALQCGAPVIAADNSSQPEVVGDAGLLANADDPADLAAKLTRVLSDGELAAWLRRKGPSQALRFNWESVADRAMTAFNEIVDDGSSSSAPHSASDAGAPYLRPKPRIAFFSPFSPLRSGVVDYSERLLRSLRDYYTIDLYHDAGYLPRADLVGGEELCEDYRRFDGCNREFNYHGIVYQMCNFGNCGYIYETLQRFPGIVVMHDLALPEFHLWYASSRGLPLRAFLTDELMLENAQLARACNRSFAAWSAEPGGIAHALLSRGVTLNRRILDHSASVLLHDDWGASRLALDLPDIADRIFVAPMGADVAASPTASKEDIKRRLGFAADSLILGCFGFVNGMKCHEESIEALAAILKDYPTARLIFAGPDYTRGQAQAHADALGVAQQVKFFGYVPRETFLQLLAITDIALNLRRPPTRGETSAALMSLLAAGVATIVTGVDAFTCFPDTVVRKVPPLSPGDRALELAIRELAADEPTRRRLGHEARAYAAAKHDWSQTAARYAEAIEWTRENRLRWSSAVGQKTRAFAAARLNSPESRRSTPPLKVLVLSNLYPPDVIGGYELCCRQMVEGLRGRGHEVTVLTTAPRQPFPAEAHVERCFHFANYLDQYARRRDGTVAQAMLEAESRFVQAANVYQLIAALERKDVSVVYLWNLMGLGGLAIVASLCYLGIPWVWHLEDCVPRDLCSFPHDPLPVLAAQYNREIRGHYLAVSRRTVQEIEQAGIELRDQVEIMPNWITGDRLAERRNFYRGGTLRVVNAGRLSHFKGTDLLIDAARLLLDRGERRFHIDIYGQGPHAEFYKLIQQKDVGEHVCLRGELPQDELCARYAKHDYDLFAFPTYAREPFGCAPLEAAAHGIVMLMSESCGIAEWFADGTHCLKAERSPAAFADRIQQVLQGRIDLAPIACLAAETIWKDFHLNALIGRVERAFESARARREPARGSPDAAYRLALLAEKLTRTWVQNTYDIASRPKVKG